MVVGLIWVEWEFLRLRRFRVEVVGRGFHWSERRVLVREKRRCEGCWCILLELFSEECWSTFDLGKYKIFYF